MRFDPGTTVSLLLSLLTFSALPSGALAARPKNAVLLSEVQSLTLRSPLKTTARRVSAIPQLKCVSPLPLCRLTPTIQTMRCTNAGASYTSQDIAWSCTATLPSTLRLDSTEVICEGYSSPDDAYVLKGSCGVEYTLALTDEGREKYPHLVGSKTKEGGLDWAGFFFWVLFIAVVGVIVYAALIEARDGVDNNNNTNNNRRRPGGGGGGGGGWGPGGGGGGGGGGRWNDPPPPYPDPKPSSSSASGSWSPGFWTGLATGSAAGYAAGNRGQRNNGQNNGGSGGWGSGSGSGSGSGWGGGRSSSPGNSGSGTPHESTGYGSTSRR
ncbi:transmembrane protein [Parachaetomium inaequale]|uniref:Store-operated calcium entry-associated regulatory factor n=1 Tax=Parachaetomium inaequale TaxID=2588326 RepID=A0AAN6SUE6_9PEZI|nr:transmembrane protein [Parachaetomium inaequale]